MATTVILVVVYKQTFHSASFAEGICFPPCLFDTTLNPLTHPMEASHTMHFQFITPHFYIAGMLFLPVTSGESTKTCINSSGGASGLDSRGHSSLFSSCMQPHTTTLLLWLLLPRIIGLRSQDWPGTTLFDTFILHMVLNTHR